ncbi:pyruvate kinase [Nitrospinae bacterium AH_259_B05_G02_I21]|nr:pyruvate kinase [Nitrospinae bacterium AH_259_B05_G02_I21]MDA2932406.1 pyruvate kinase [Nitrospinae bacterium AH-259-F20]
MKLPSHKTKIVCTIGPASRSESVLKKLVKSGMSVARLNFSHGTLEGHRENIRRIRSVAAQLDRVVMVLMDLPGPKIRIGKLQNEPLVLKRGDNVTLTTNDVLGTASRISINYDKLPASVSKGSPIFLNDGFIKLRVQEELGNEVRCKVIIGGQLMSNKGLNIPGVKLLIDVVTDKDLDLVDFGLKEGVDAFSVSFVEKAEDIVQVKEFARKRGKPIYVVAKIEREEAVNNIDEILNVADAIMIARGDLGVQMPIEDGPAVQKKLIHKANLLGRPVITATQMLESMTENVRPTRAEVTDVANAILDGTDAVMLSEETAIGRYPVETVRMMARIAGSIERQRLSIIPSSSVEESFLSGVGQKTVSIEDVVSLNVIEAMRALNARFILTPTETGNTPRRISRFKPDCWILAFSKFERTHRFLSLSYGVYPFLIENKVDSWHDLIMKLMKDARLGKRGDKVILTEGLSSGQAGGTDSLRIITLI